jgi:predicted murein hydrolase (TIGR00659 family)
MNQLNAILHHRATLATLEVTVLWSVVTILLYWLVKYFYKKLPRWWTAPLILTPVLLIAITILSHTDYTVYIAGTHWLVVLLGPATVAFAVPIYRQRALVHRYWKTLIVGVVFGSGVSIASAWMLATTLGLSGNLRLSLLPRSISTPFAMTVSGEIGGIPELTAIFVIITGIVGASFGESVLYILPLRSALARGSSFGMGAHVLGSKKAHEIGPEEGAVAGLVMVLTGIFNVLAAPLLELVLKTQG